MSITSNEFKDFYQATYPELVRFGERLRGGQGEDLAQSTCSRVWARRDQYGLADLRPVSFQTLRNLVTDQQRRDQVVRLEPHDFNEPGLDGYVPERLEPTLSLGLLRRFISQEADPEIRIVMTLRWLDEFNECEIVVLLGATRRRIRTILAAGRTALEREFGSLTDR